MFCRTKGIKLIIIQIPRNYGTTINDSNNTAFDKSIFLIARDSYYYLLLDSDSLENTVDLIHKEGRKIFLGFVRCSTHTGWQGWQGCNRAETFNGKAYE